MVPLKARLVNTIEKFTEHTGQACVLVNGNGHGCCGNSCRHYPLLFADGVYSAPGVRYLFALHGVYAGPCLYPKA